MGTKDPLTSMRSVYLAAGIIAAGVVCVACWVMARRADAPSPWHGWETIFHEDEGTLAGAMWLTASGWGALIVLILALEAIRRWKM